MAFNKQPSMDSLYTPGAAASIDAVVSELSCHSHSHSLNISLILCVDVVVADVRGDANGEGVHRLHPAHGNVFIHPVQVFNNYQVVLIFCWTYLLVRLDST